ncbi:MAG: carbohydrate ABC transporter permease [Caldilinea sp.]
MAARTNNKWLALQRASAPYLLILPALAFVVGVLAYSVLYGVGMSFFRVDLTRPGTPFVGLGNYATLYASPEFWNSLTRSLIFVFFSVVLGLVLSMSFAYALYRTRRFSGFFKGLTLIPYLVSGIATAIMFRFIFSGNVGLVNQILQAMGFERVLFLSSPNWALTIIILANAWFIIPFSTLVLLAGLQSLDPEILEAARADGATGIRVFFQIIVPLIKPMLGIALVWMSFASFNMFDVVLPLTGGGPGNATEVLAVHMYRVGFEFLRYSEGSAIMTVIWILNIVTSVTLLRIFHSEE